MSQRPSCKRRLLKIAGCLLAAIIVVVVAATVWINVRGAAAQREVLAELERRGWWPATYPPADEPSFVLLGELAAAVQPDAALSESLPMFGMVLTDHGSAIDTSTADALRNYATSHQDALDRLKAAINNGSLRLPSGREGDEHYDAFSHLRTVAKAACLWSLHEQAQGNADAAVDRLLLIATLRRDTSGGSMMRHLTHSSMDTLFHEAVCELYSRCTPSATATDSVIAALNRVDTQTGLIALQRAEVISEAEVLVGLDQYIHSTVTMSPIVFEDWQQSQQVTQHPFSGDLREGDPLIGVLPASMQSSTKGNIELDMWLTKWGYRLWPGRWRSIQAAQVRDQLDASDRFASVADIWSDPRTNSHHSLHFSAVDGTERSVVGWALMCEQFRIEHGRWPRLPEELALPDDLLHHVQPDGIIVYHIGPNGVDDGGVQNGLHIVGGDIAFRLLDPAVRGKLAPPSEADENDPLYSGETYE